MYDEDGFCVDILEKLGNYFQDHFGFRSHYVTANAKFSKNLFGVSEADGVIAGKNGWLYYKDSLEDYLGIEQMTDRALFCAAHTLAMMQRYAETRGCRFLFTAVPNKNTLYGENMPYYDRMKVSAETNLTRLPAFLEEEGVAYADLYGLFASKEEILYHKRDSHWNQKGAALASAVLLEKTGKETVDWENEPYETRCDFAGDLDAMLFPEAVSLEEEIYFDRKQVFAYVGEVESNFDPMIATVNPSAEGSLVMYRDSFGNALLPFMADAFAHAYFSRGVPYQMEDLALQNADTLIVERAQRFLPEMAENPPVMSAPVATECPETETVQDSGGTAAETEAAQDGVGGAAAEMETVQDGAEEITEERFGAYDKISGFVKAEYLDTRSRIYLRCADDTIYEAFPAVLARGEGKSDAGFVAYIDNTKRMQADEPLEVLVCTGGKWINVYQKGTRIQG